MFCPSSRTPLCTDRSHHGVVACACLLVCLLVPRVRGAELAELQVGESEGVYRISLVMQVQAPAHHVQRVLTDYPRIYRLNPAITESEVLPAPDDGVVRVRTRMLDCIGFFCKEIDRVEDVRESGTGGLEATTVPALSSFKSGSAEWQIHGMGERSQVSYQAQMEPDFYIPPLIGSYFVKQKLVQAMLASVERIECIARIQADLEQMPPADPTRLAKAATAVPVMDATLLAGGDPTGFAAAPAAGRPSSGRDGCARSCVGNDAAGQP